MQKRQPIISLIGHRERLTWNMEDFEGHALANTTLVSVGRVGRERANGTNVESNSGTLRLKALH